MGKQSTFFIVFLPPTPTLDPTGLRFLGLTAGGRLTINGFFFFTFELLLLLLLLSLFACLSVTFLLLTAVVWDEDERMVMQQSLLELQPWHCPLLFPSSFSKEKSTHTGQSLCWRCWQKCAADVSDAVVSSQLKRKIMERTCEFKRIQKKNKRKSLSLFPRLLALCPHRSARFDYFPRSLSFDNLIIIKLKLNKISAVWTMMLFLLTICQQGGPIIITLDSLRTRSFFFSTGKRH